MIVQNAYIFSATLTLALCIFGGCGKSTPSVTKPSADGVAYLLPSKPTNPQSVSEARKSSSDNDEITLVGRIGGDVKPWVEGQAAFSLVDIQLKPCNEKGDDACETPWDYCCDTDVLGSNKALVKVVDQSGKTVAKDARQLLGIKELQTLVVRGRAKRDQAGNLTVLASGIYIQQ